MHFLPCSLCPTKLFSLSNGVRNQSSYDICAGNSPLECQPRLQYLLVNERDTGVITNNPLGWDSARHVTAHVLPSSSRKGPTARSKLKKKTPEINRGEGTPDV